MFLIVLLNFYRICNPIFDTEELSISILFFYLGILLADYDGIIIDFLDKLSIVYQSVLAVVLIALYFVCYYKQCNIICEIIRFVSGIFLSLYIFKIAKYFTKVEKIKKIGVLSFWVYCAHQPFSMICIQKGVIFLLRRCGLMNFYVLHGSVFILDLVFTIAIGCILYRFMPSVFYILTGKRNTKG